MATELSQVLESIAELKTSFTDLKTEVEKLEDKVDASNIKFDIYQKATSSLVNLAFGLIASATIITIVNGIFHS
jgi:hypothetical protein